MRLRHWRAARRTHPSTAGPPGARRPRTGRRTSRTTSLRQIPAGDLVREGQGIHHAGFFRSFGGVVGAASSRRRFLVCAAVKPCVRRDEEPSPVWVNASSLATGCSKTVLAASLPVTSGRRLDAQRWLPTRSWPPATPPVRSGRPLARQACDRRNHRNRMTLAHPPHRDARMHTTGQSTQCRSDSPPARPLRRPAPTPYH